MLHQKLKIKLLLTALIKNCLVYYSIISWKLIHELALRTELFTAITSQPFSNF